MEFSLQLVQQAMGQSVSMNKGHLTETETNLSISVYELSAIGVRTNNQWLNVCYPCRGPAFLPMPC